MIQLGYIAGSNFILKTTNAGEDWMVKLDDYSNSLHSIYFTDENTGYAVGSTYDVGWHNCILKTTDGGNTWFYVSIGITDDWLLNSVFFVNRDTGWVAGYGADFRKTTDGGLSWINQSLGINGYNDILNAVYFINENIGWVVGNEGKLFKTTNGGTTWVSKSSPLTSEHLNSVFFVDSKFGWIAGENGTVLHTTNSGTNWTKQSFPSLNSLFSIFFVDKNVGWCAGSTIHKTTDTGSNWVYQYTPTTVNSIFLMDANNGWAVCNDGMTLKTTNGKDWNIKLTGTNYDFFSIQFINNNIGWVSGIFSTYIPGYGAFHSRRILKTIDGGETWIQLYSSAYYSYLGTGDIFFVDQNRGWVCNPGLPLLKTTDGGSNWIELGYDGGSSIHFIDYNTGWIVGNDQGKIYQSTDGGESWMNQPSGVNSMLNSVYFIDDSTVWVVGDNGTILSTIKNQNGGDDSIDTQLPSQFKLFQNYPNPFNPSTVISYQLPVTSNVTLKVYDILGREVATLVNEEKPAGSYEVEFNPALSIKNPASGIYFYQLTAGDYTETKKMILLK